MNENKGSVYVNLRNNRFLSRMRDKAIISQFMERNIERRRYEGGRDGIFQFMIEYMAMQLSRVIFMNYKF